MNGEEKVWTNKTWPAICPKCEQRRILYPVNQNINSLNDPNAQFIHIKGGEVECS